MAEIEIDDRIASVCRAPASHGVDFVVGGAAARLHETGTQRSTLGIVSVLTVVDAVLVGPLLSPGFLVRLAWRAMSRVVIEDDTVSARSWRGWNDPCRSRC